MCEKPLYPPAGQSFPVHRRVSGGSLAGNEKQLKACLNDYKAITSVEDIKRHF